MKMSDSKNYGHVTFPLSLTKEEREQFGKFCKNQGQTMSGRIKELIRKDMGFTVLSSFDEEYQKRIISAFQNKKPIIIKSRQMFISQILLSCLLHEMLQENGSEPIRAAFVSPNLNGCKNHHERFIRLCDGHGIEMKRNGGSRVEIYNGATVHFLNDKRQHDDYDILVLDEFAFHGMSRQELDELTAHNGRIIISSTPKKDSLFNSLAIDAMNQKNALSACVAHWSMNSLYNSAPMEAVPYSTKDGMYFRVTSCSDRYRMLGEDRYLEEMECALLMSPKDDPTAPDEQGPQASCED